MEKLEKIQKQSEEKLRKQTYNILLKNDLDWKINHALEKIREYINVVKKEHYYVAFSGGKDSQVLLMLLLKVLKPERIILSISNEVFFPEIKENIEKWKNKYNWYDVQEYEPKLSFWEQVPKYGLFYSSKNRSRAVNTLKRWIASNFDNVKYKNIDYVFNFMMGKKLVYLLKNWDYEINNKCCDFIKYKVDSDFIGLRITEGISRLNGWLKSGCNNFSKNKNYSKPISLFTDDNIYDFVKKENETIPSIYNHMKRTGCMCCPFGAREKVKYIWKDLYPQIWKMYKNTDFWKILADNNVKVAWDFDYEKKRIERQEKIKNWYVENAEWYKMFLEKVEINKKINKRI